MLSSSPPICFPSRLSSVARVARRARSSARCRSRIALTSGSRALPLNAAGISIVSREFISASRRAFMAISRYLFRTSRLSLALAAVSSMRTRIWFASTTSPSLTAISRMMPPSKCWTSLFCPVATNVPEATTALFRGATPAQTPKQPSPTTRMARPAKMGHLALSGTPRCHSPVLSFSALMLSSRAGHLTGPRIRCVAAAPACLRRTTEPGDAVPRSEIQKLPRVRPAE